MATTNRVQLNMPQTAQMLGCGTGTVKKLTALGHLTDTSPQPAAGATKRFSTYDMAQVQALARTNWRQLTRPAAVPVVTLAPSVQLSLIDRVTRLENWVRDIEKSFQRVG